MELIMETATQPCNDSITNVKLIEAQPLPEWSSLLSSPWDCASPFFSSCLNKKDTIVIAVIFMNQLPLSLPI